MAVNQKLLDKLLELKAGMQPSTSTVVLRAAALNREIADLAGTGAPPAAPQDAVADAGCLRMRPDDVSDVELPPLSFGGADIVALVRHGLPAIYSPAVGYVLYPERDGVMCAAATLAEAVQRPLGSAVRV